MRALLTTFWIAAHALMLAAVFREAGGCGEGEGLRLNHLENGGTL